LAETEVQAGFLSPADDLDLHLNPRRFSNSPERGRKIRISRSGGLAEYFCRNGES
jgi:hypothetical protein